MNESKRTGSAQARTGAGHTGENTSGTETAATAVTRSRPHRHRFALAVTGAAAALALSIGSAAGLSASATGHARTVAAGTTQSVIPFTGQPTDPGQGSDGSTQQDAAPASAEESSGVVLIDTQLGYENAEAAGTGIVLSKDGLILTNNHVIADSTKIAVTVATTGKTYEASVVGSDSAHDVAVLRLKDATDLTPAAVDDETVQVGDDITAVGNSEGGGQLQAADGTVTDLGASVTTTAQGTEDSETLDGMIQVQADIVSGDSGGALLDDEGEVVGMNTAASSGTPVVTGYAIPIDSALTTAESIIAGQQTSTNTLGYPAFLGIGVGRTERSDQQDRSGQPAQSGQPGQGMQSGQTGQGTQSGQPGQGTQSGQTGTDAVAGAVVAGVYEDTPAAKAGLTAGDTITAIDSTQISDGTAASSAIAEHKPGDRVSLTWTDTTGQSHTTEVTLTEGPAS